MAIIGIKQIKVGEAAPNGTMPTDMTKIGKVYQGTCKIAQDAPEVKEHFEENVAAPDIVIKQNKMPKVTFSLFDVTPQMLAEFIGGTVTGTGNTESWGYDGTEVVANKAIALETSIGNFDIEIPNADIQAVIDADMSKQGIFLVNFTVTPAAVTAGKALKTKAKSST